MLKKIWLYPPLALARLGSSTQPCDNYQWGPEDLSPHGTARTRVLPMPSLDVGPDGRVTLRPTTSNSEVRLKDEQGFRPVCPFFELHGQWVNDQGQTVEGPLTASVLASLGLSAAQLVWRVHVANRKAWRYTQAEGDIVHAEVQVHGDDHLPQVLQGQSSGPAAQRLVPEGQFMPLGTVQVTRPTPEWPEMRLRFTPPQGLVYGPQNFAQRLAGINQANACLEKKVKEAVPSDHPAHNLLMQLVEVLKEYNQRWLDAPPQSVRPVLNPAAAWANWAWPREVPLSIAAVLNTLSAGGPNLLAGLLGGGDQSELVRHLAGVVADAGNLPPAVFAFSVEPGRLMSGMGLLDDINDGLVEATFDGLPHLAPARARVVVTPPTLVPDRRMPVSLADGLTDRVARDEARSDDWVAGPHADQADDEVHDLLARAFETVGLQNVDAVIDFFVMENTNRAIRVGDICPQAAAARLWPAQEAPLQPLPMTAVARQHHRRLVSCQAFEAFVRGNPGWMSRIRTIDPGSLYYDQRMPGVMRGFDRQPLCLTRRQYALLQAWTQRICSQP